jgi:hypothetical protein
LPINRSIASQDDNLGLKRFRVQQVKSTLYGAVPSLNYLYKRSLYSAAVLFTEREWTGIVDAIEASRYSYREKLWQQRNYSFPRDLSLLWEPLNISFAITTLQRQQH